MQPTARTIASALRLMPDVEASQRQSLEINMALELKKATPVSLRSLGLDERWLQDRIDDDPSLLGLGDLDVIRRERKQGSGGRIDFLMLPEPMRPNLQMEPTRHTVGAIMSPWRAAHLKR